MDPRPGTRWAKRARRAPTAIAVTGALLLWHGAALAGTGNGGDTGLGGLGDVVTGTTDQLEDTADELIEDLGDRLPAGGVWGDKGQVAGSDMAAEGDDLGVDVAGREVLRAAGSEASAGGRDSRSGTTILAVLGHQILGAGAYDETGWEESAFGSLGFACAASEGALCVDLLYGHWWGDGTRPSSGVGRETADGDLGAGGSAGRSDGTGSGGATAEGRVLHLELLGQEILVVGRSDSSAGDDGAAAGATVLAILGQEIIGTRSDSEDGSGRSETGLLLETCGQTEGQACLALLYGRASTEDDGDRSHGDSGTAVATACLGGSGGAWPEGQCDGPVGATVLDTSGESNRDKLNNSADAHESSNGATLCLGGEDEDGVCETFGLLLLHSESESHARPGDATAEGDAYIIGVDQSGERTVYMEDETTVDVPSDCPAGGSIACLILNEENTRAVAGGIANDVAVIRGDILPGTINDLNGGNLHEGEVGTTAVAMTGEGVVPEGPVVKPEGPHERPTVRADRGSRLPFTGMDAGTMLAIAVMLLLSGAGTLILAARREAPAR